MTCVLNKNASRNETFFGRRNLGNSVSKSDEITSSKNFDQASKRRSPMRVAAPIILDWRARNSFPV